MLLRFDNIFFPSEIMHMVCQKSTCQVWKKKGKEIGVNLVWRELSFRLLPCEKKCICKKFFLVVLSPALHIPPSFHSILILISPLVQKRSYGRGNPGYQRYKLEERRLFIQSKVLLQFGFVIEKLNVF